MPAIVDRYSLLAMHERSFVILALVLLTVQAPPAGQTLAFDAASIKPVESDPRGTFALRWAPGGSFTAHMPLTWLISRAYGIRLEHVVGGPDWVRDRKWVVEARAGREVTHPERLAMLRILLEDRFRLVLRNEIRELPGYALVLARQDGRLGPGIRRREGACPKEFSSILTDWELQPGRPSPCGLLFSQRFRTGGKQSMRLVITAIRPAVGAEEVDQTGLTGELDFYFPMPSAGAASPSIAMDATDASIFTIVQEHLGMKLEPQRVPTPVLVIERAEQPQPN